MSHPGRLRAPFAALLLAALCMIAVRPARGGDEDDQVVQLRKQVDELRIRARDALAELEAAKAELKSVKAQLESMTERLDQAQAERTAEQTALMRELQTALSDRELLRVQATRDEMLAAQVKEETARERRASEQREKALASRIRAEQSWARACIDGQVAGLARMGPARALLESRMGGPASAERIAEARALAAAGGSAAALPRLTMWAKDPALAPELRRAAFAARVEVAEPGELPALEGLATEIGPGARIAFAERWIECGELTGLRMLSGLGDVPAGERDALARACARALGVGGVTPTAVAKHLPAVLGRTLPWVAAGILGLERMDTTPAPALLEEATLRDAVRVLCGPAFPEDPELPATSDEKVVASGKGRSALTVLHEILGTRGLVCRANGARLSFGTPEYFAPQPDSTLIPAPSAGESPALRRMRDRLRATIEVRGSLLEVARVVAEGAGVPVVLLPEAREDRLECFSAWTPLPAIEAIEILEVVCGGAVLRGGVVVIGRPEELEALGAETVGSAPTPTTAADRQVADALARFRLVASSEVMSAQDVARALSQTTGLEVRLADDVDPDTDCMIPLGDLGGLPGEDLLRACLLWPHLRHRITNGGIVIERRP